jgi:hypothetical protein
MYENLFDACESATGADAIGRPQVLDVPDAQTLAAPSDARRKYR